jgi:DNA-binding GntR family transcriptional regulator
MNADRLPEPLERATTFSGRTVEVLRDMVVSGRLRAGERLNEVELASALGISRGPLREAIQHLHSEGLLTIIPNRGAYVRVITPEQLRELYEVRIALETHALRSVARTASAGEIAGLGRMLDAADSAVGSGQAYPRDLDFHQAIIALTGNQALCAAATDAYRQIDLARARSGHEPLRAKLALAEHREICERLADGRGAAAVRMLEKHLRSSLANALQILEQDSAAAPVVSGSRG